MVHCAVEYGSPCEADHVTFGEFCVLVDELRHHYESCTTAGLPHAILPSKAKYHGLTGRRKRRGPTRWRQEEAIPERADLRRGRWVLVDLIERNGIPVFSEMEKALACTALNVQQGIRVQDLTLKHGAQPVRHGHTLVGRGPALRLGYRCFTGQELSAAWLQQQRPDVSSFSFEEFCCIVAEHKRRKPSTFMSVCSALFSPVKWMFGHTRSQIVPDSNSDMFDIYLGGSCGDSNWREEIALPLIKRHGLSYHNPHVTEWFSRLIPMQVAEREKCRVMLYVITDSTRALAAMTEAAYYIGLGCRVVLCMQKLRPDSTISGEEVSKSALLDYNRGRAYLSDMGSREGVPEFDNIAEAVESAIAMVKEPSKQ
nr:hypothetical protein BaRGS_003412 [Batillaria attramentaria]